MKHYFIFFLAIFIISCNSDNVKIHETYPNGNPRVTLEYFDKSDTCSYIMRSFYQSGGLEMEAEIEDNIMTGKTSYYYENGQLKYEGIQVDNKFHGKLTFWYPNGNIWQIVNYNHGLLNDSLREYYPDGILKGEGFFENGSGQVIYYHHNSTISRFGFMQSNLETGKWEAFDSLGRKYSVGHYLDGKRHGNYELYDTLGNITEKGIYKNGLIADASFMDNKGNPQQDLNDKYKIITNNQAWSDSQRKSEISDCVNQMIKLNHNDPNGYCYCRISTIEQFLAYKDYILASDIEINEIMRLYGEKCD
jgi:antitoxin component YwqK of YwqJK toxin-antitoxin module